MPIRKTDGCPRCAVATGSALSRAVKKDDVSHERRHQAAHDADASPDDAKSRVSCTSFLWHRQSKKSYFGYKLFHRREKQVGAEQSRSQYADTRNDVDHEGICRTIQISHAEDNADPQNGRMPALGCSDWLGSGSRRINCEHTFEITEPLRVVWRRQLKHAGRVINLPHSNRDAF
jgi:hypothetical protein